MGRDVSSGDPIAVEGDAVITHVDPLLNARDQDTWISPGFIDLQVNGFAGADYNSAETSHQQIAGSLAALFSTGVTRCFPTIITGPESRILGALGNLVRARATLPHGAAMEGGAHGKEA